MLLNIVYNMDSKKFVKILSMEYLMLAWPLFLPRTFLTALKQIGKASGIDGLFAEHCVCAHASAVSTYHYFLVCPIGGVYIPHTFTALQQYLNLHVDKND